MKNMRPIFLPLALLISSAATTVCLCLCVLTAIAPRESSGSIEVIVSACVFSILLLCVTAYLFICVCVDYRTLANSIKALNIEHMPSIMLLDRPKVRRGKWVETISLLITCRVEEYKAQMLYKRAEVVALQSQINPHFLYNTLESIRGQALIENCTVIADMAEALSRLFRYSISGHDVFKTLEDELENVNNYVMIQQYRFSNRFIIKKNIDDPVLLDCLIPKLIIQPLVENAIYHGLETKPGKGSIQIHVYGVDDYLVINVSDDGVGMSAEQVSKLNQSLAGNAPKDDQSDQDANGTGIALGNINERIQLLYGKGYGLSVNSTPSVGTSIEILIPAIRAKTEAKST